MTKKHIISPALPVSAPVAPKLTSEQATELRAELNQLLKARRLLQVPRLTQQVLSERLGYPYSIVTGWENGTRLLYVSNFSAWLEGLGIDQEEGRVLYARYSPIILCDERAGLETGSRIDTEVNERFSALRKERRFTIREIARLTGISTGHLQRIESNASNLSVAQVRGVVKALRLNYEWLIEGKGEPSAEPLHKELARLQRDNELLENFRQEVLKNGG